MFLLQAEKAKGSKDIETGTVTTLTPPRFAFLQGIFGRILLQSFTLTFLAEWGDRSQIATIILGAREVSIFQKLPKNMSFI